MVAGCVFATYEVKSYVVAAFRGVLQRHESICLSLHIDDLSVSANAETRAGLAQILQDTAEDLSAVVAFDLRLVFAQEKISTIASDTTTLKTVLAAIGPGGGRGASTIRKLGVDYLFARKKSYRQGAVRHQRSKQGFLRLCWHHK